MNAAQVLTVAGVITGVVATVVAWLQLRRTPRLPKQANLGAKSVAVSAGRPAGGTVLRPPTGRLPIAVCGRDDIRSLLISKVKKPDGRAHLITGLGGCGKTTVALAVAEHAAGRREPVWWVSAAERVSVVSQFLELARALGAPPGEVDEALAGLRNPADLLWHFLEECPGWVLIIDNADDPHVLSLRQQRAGDGTAWVRPTRAGLLLITSRSGDPLIWGRHVEIHPVGWLNDAEGARVLQGLAPGAGDARDAAVLSSKLGGLPLALHHAGSHLASRFAREKTFLDYCQSLETSFSKLMSEGPDDRSAVISTWEISLDQLAANGAGQSRALLRVLACFASAVPIPWFLLDYEVLARGCPDHHVDDVGPGLDALRTVGLIEVSAQGEGPGSWSVVVHPLVAETILANGEDCGLTSHAVRTAAEVLVAVTDSLRRDDPAQWPMWELLVPHVKSLLANGPPGLGEIWAATLGRAAADIAYALIWSGAYTAALELSDTALRDVHPDLSEYPEVLRLRCVRARANLNLRKLDESERELRAIIIAQQRILGSDHKDTMDSSHELAATLSRQGRFSEAEALYRDIIARHERISQPGSSASFSSRHEFARVLAEQGRYSEAESIYHDLLAARIRVHGPAYPGTLITRFRIADLNAKLERSDEAERLFREILSECLRVLGPGHPDTLKVKCGLAATLSVNGRISEADREYREALSRQRQVLGVNHPATLSTEAALSALDIRHADHEI